MEQKTCTKCNQSKSITEFYTRKGKQNRNQIYHNWCKVCCSANGSDRDRQRKYEALQIVGTSCAHCGYDKYYGALEFHHTDPSKKDFSLRGTRTMRITRLLPELKKCITLCANCHREEHSRMKGVELTSLPKVNHFAKLQERLPPKACKICQTEISKQATYCKKCVPRELSKPKHVTYKIDWPEASELLKMLETSNYSKLGIKLGVSDNAIRKRIKNYPAPDPA